MKDARQSHVRRDELKPSGRLLLQGEHLRKSFGGQQVLADVSLQLREGEVVLLRGENGSGKTTLLNILTGHLEPEQGLIEKTSEAVTSRHEFPLRWWERMNPLDGFAPEHLARDGIGRTWQDMRLFGRQSLRENLMVAKQRQKGENPVYSLLRWCGTRQEEHALSKDVDLILARLSLGDRAGSSANRVSLGQAKRVAIARAVQAGAHVLFLDEPLAGLDARGVSDVLVFLDDLVRRCKLTLVIVEHFFHIPRVLRLADTVWTLEGGSLQVESAAMAQAEMLAKARESIITVLRRGFEVGLVEKSEELLGGGKLTKLWPSGREKRGNALPLLDVNDLVVHRGERLVIGTKASDGTTTGLSFKLYEGEIALLQAPNGWGKTTLLETIAGLIHPTNGTIKSQGEDIRRMSVWERANNGINFVTANTQAYQDLTVSEFLRLVKPDHAEPTKATWVNRHLQDLSGGERQQIHLMALRHQAHVRLLDEPFASLSIAEAIRFVGERIAPESSGAFLLALPALDGNME